MALGLDFVLHLAVAGRVGGDLGLVLDHFDIALQRDLAFRSAADVFRLDRGDGVFILDAGWPHLGLGVGRHCRDSDEGSQGIGPGVRGWGGR